MPDVIAKIAAFVMPLLPGFFAGYLLGRLARSALRTALLIGGGVALALFALAHFGVDTSTLEGWLRLGSSWAGEKLQGAKQYLAAVLPAAAALAVGFKIGMARG